MREFLAFAVAGIGTYFTRSVFIIGGERIELPAVVKRALKYVGPAVLSSLVAVSITAGEGLGSFVTPRPETLAALVCIAVAWWKKNVVLTVVVGLIVVWALQQVMD